MQLPAGLRLDISTNPTHEESDFLAYRLEDFNDIHWPGHQRWSPLGLFIRRDAEIVAGLVGHIYAGGLFVHYLWLSEALRGQGIGRQLLTEAEDHARRHGCHLIWLDTYSFQAPGFYQRLGYQIFGELDYPDDRKRLFLHKRLSPADASS